VLAEAKHKGKEKAKLVDSPLRSISTSRAKGSPGSASVSVDLKAKEMSASDAALFDGAKDETRKRSLLGSSTTSAPRKKRKVGQRFSDIVIDATDQSSQLPLSGTSISALRGGRTRQQKATLEPPPLPTESKNAETPTPLLRKVKLIVRRPAPVLSHPRQKPLPSRYDASISKFLSSYVSLHDGKDADVSALEAMAKRDAAILDKRERFRKQGRLIVRYDGDSSTQVGDDAPLRSHAVWQSILELVAARDPTESARQRDLVTSQITAKIKAYWDMQALKQEKHRAIEEKRLRSLAKETIRLVVNEWKRAVLVIFTCPSFFGY
jgi:helicase SWR1